jgi:hypothetical protein
MLRIREEEIMVEEVKVICEAAKDIVMCIVLAWAAVSVIRSLFGK